jgi:hypothetical protein
MSGLADQNCPLLIHFESSNVARDGDIQAKLESKNDDDKVEGLKQIISHILVGENMSKLIMTVIKYCLHSENHFIKKLLLMYWEVVDKKNKDGALLPEMILVCNAMKNNLSHANEFIRGSTLRHVASYFFFYLAVCACLLVSISKLIHGVILRRKHMLLVHSCSISLLFIWIVFYFCTSDPLLLAMSTDSCAR